MLRGAAAVEDEQPDLLDPGALRPCSADASGSLPRSKVMRWSPRAVAFAAGGVVVGPGARRRREVGDPTLAGLTIDSRRIGRRRPLRGHPGQARRPLFRPGDVEAGRAASSSTSAGSRIARRQEPPAGARAWRCRWSWWPTPAWPCWTWAGRPAMAGGSGRGHNRLGRKDFNQGPGRGGLSAGLRAVGSEKSFNNELGVPLTLANAPETDRGCGAGDGLTRPGHIARLCQVARPTIGVVTAVAAAHTEAFGNLTG